jgi:hypothetical protein
LLCDQLRPALHDEFGDEVQVGARVDVVRDARGDDTQYRRGALSALVHPGEKPVLPAENEPAQLALTALMPRPGLCRVGAFAAAK